MKKLLVIFITCLGIWELSAQKPVISGLNKYSATVGETIIISGANFPTTTSNVIVNFGAGVGTVISSTNTEIRATVPASSTYGPVIVTDLSTGLIGSSSQYFTLSYGGSSFETSALDDIINFTTNQQYPYGLCNCDFDGDGMLDVAVANEGSSVVSIFKNTSDISTTSFTTITITTSINTIGTKCGDLNGDGLPDLIFVSRENVTEQIFIYENTSVGGNISFSALETFTLPLADNGDSRSPRGFRIKDLDLDGKPELVISETGDSDNKIFIYPNTSISNISFDTDNPIDISVTGAPQTGAIDIADLDNDQLPDIIALPYTTANQPVFVLKNTSIPGTISFEEPITVDDSGIPNNVMAIDVNGDNFIDIVTAHGNGVFIALNNGTVGNFEFPESNFIDISIEDAFGLSAGDLNGDGYVDIAVTSTTEGLYVLENSGGSSPSFSTINIETEYTPRNIEIADYNGDAKPDLGFTHRSEPNTTGFFSVITNRNCISPEITPTDLTFCSGSEFTLEATNSINASYTWTFTGDVTLQSQSGNEATFVVNSGNTASITVTIATTDGSCSTSQTEVYTITGGSQPSAPTITNSASSSICAGSDFTLSGPTGMDEYLWTLPDGSTETTQTITITDAGIDNAGEYSLRVKPTDGCFSPESTTDISVDQPPVIYINNTGASDIICEGSSTPLQVSDYDGFSYQWQVDGSNVGTDASTLTATSGGSYTVTITSETTGCSYNSSSFDLVSYELPTPVISAIDNICTNVDLEFDASSSTGESGATLTYAWDYGDGSTGTGENTTHSYTTSGIYTISLSVAYADLTSCSTTVTQSITVSDAPSSDEIIAMISPDPATTGKCPEDALTLSLPDDFQSYTWTANGSVVSTSNTADITTNSNQESVNVTINVVTDIGCAIDGTVITVSNYEGSGFDFSSPDGSIINDTLELTDPLRSVDVTVSNGSSYEWSPADILSSTSGADVTVYPKDRITNISVTGNDTSEGECETNAILTIISPGIIARKSFSPNGDNVGYDCWEILNSESLDGCTVYIYDEKGSIVFKGNSPFADNCVWNGNLNNGSSQLPPGVYYFVLKCDAASYNQTGTILLAR